MHYKGENTKSIISQKLRIAQKTHSGEKSLSDQFQSFQLIWLLLNKAKIFVAEWVALWRPIIPNQNGRQKAHKNSANVEYLSTAHEKGR